MVRFGKYMLIDELGGLDLARPESTWNLVPAPPETLAICRWRADHIDPVCGANCDCLECPPGNPGFHHRCAELRPQLPLPEHPNVIRLFEIGRREEYYFVALQLVRGVRVGSVLHRGASLPIAMALFIAAEVARGLAALHALPTARGPGLVHDNLSPEAILVTAEGTVVVSSLIRCPVRKSDLHWLTPDHLHDAPVDHRTDLFALGMVLYTMLTGHHILEDATQGGELRLAALQRFTASPPSGLRRDVPPQLDRIVERALARPLLQRYQHAAELERDLRQVLASMAPRFAQADLAQYLRQLDLPMHPAMP